MTDIESIIDEAELPEKSVTLCLKGSLVAAYERLDTALQEAARQGPASTLSLAGEDTSATDGLVAQMAELREQMLAHERVFVFRALPPLDFSNVRARVPVKAAGQPHDEFTGLYHSWLCGLVAATCVDPPMTPEQADRLSRRLSDAQWRDLRDGAWEVNAQKQDVPFSVVASEMSRVSALRSRLPGQPESPDLSSLAGNLDPGPATSTTPTTG
jgi:hypothetical protein